MTGDRVVPEPEMINNSLGLVKHTFADLYGPRTTVDEYVSEMNRTENSKNVNGVLDGDNNMYPSDLYSICDDNCNLTDLNVENTNVYPAGVVTQVEDVMNIGLVELFEEGRDFRVGNKMELKVAVS